MEGKAYVKKKKSQGLKEEIWSYKHNAQNRKDTNEELVNWKKIWQITLHVSQRLYGRS